MFKLVCNTAYLRLKHGLQLPWGEHDLVSERLHVIVSSSYCNWVGDRIECMYELESWSLRARYHRSGWMQLIGSWGYLVLSGHWDEILIWGLCLFIFHVVLPLVHTCGLECRYSSRGGQGENYEYYCSSFVFLISCVITVNRFK